MHEIYDKCAPTVSWMLVMKTWFHCPLQSIQIVPNQSVKASYATDRRPIALYNSALVEGKVEDNIDDWFTICQTNDFALDASSGIMYG